MIKFIPVVKGSKLDGESIFYLNVDSIRSFDIQFFGSLDEPYCYIYANPNYDDPRMTALGFRYPHKFNNYKDAETALKELIENINRT